MPKITITTVPPPPGLYEDAGFVFHYLIFVGLAHLAPRHPDAKRTLFTVFVVNGACHVLTRSASYTGMRVCDHGDIELALDRAKTAADEIPNSEVVVGNPEVHGGLSAS